MEELNGPLRAASAPLVTVNWSRLRSLLSAASLGALAVTAAGVWAAAVRNRRGPQGGRPAPQGGRSAGRPRPAAAAARSVPEKIEAANQKVRAALEATRAHASGAAGRPRRARRDRRR